MLTLEAGQTIQGVAGTGSAVTYSIFGDEFTLVTGVDTFKLLAQGQVPTPVAILGAAVPAGKAWLVRSILLANTTASAVAVTMYVGGSTAPFQIASLPIPANGEATFDSGGWQVRDANGAVITTSALVLNSVDNTILADMATARFKGRTTAGTGDPEDLTATQATAMLNTVTSALKGLMSVVDKNKLDGAYKDIITDFGADNSGTFDCTAIIVTAIASFTSTGGRLYFPAGTYKVDLASIATITIDKPIIFFGAGRAISNISCTHATKTVFTMATGAQGAGFEQLRITGSAAGTRTAGFAVDFGAISNVYMQQCDILFMWSGVRSGGALQFIDDMNIREGGQNAASGAAVLVVSTGDRYIRRLTTDQTNVATYAGIRINECSSCVITDSNIIHSGNAIDIVANAGVGHAVASIDAVNCFFDTSTNGANITCSTVNDTVQRVTFVRCWFSTHTTNGCTISHANVNSVDFIGCEFYQNAVGLDATACTEWAMRASRVAGNTTAGIRTTAGATHSFTISDNFIGAGAGFAANALGINIQAGTYKRYQVLDNRGLETNTTPGITDLGVVGATDQKSVNNNMGALITGAIASQGVTPLSVPVTTETLVLTARIPANAVSVGQVFRYKAVAVTAGANVCTWRTRVGAVGTVAGDTVVADIVVTAAGFANGRSTYEGILTVRSLGAPGSCQAEGHAITSTAANAAAAAQTTAAVAATSAITTTAAWFIDISLAQTINSALIQHAVIEAM